MSTATSKIKARGMVFTVRDGTTDEKVIPEVVTRHCYERKDFRILPGETWADIGANIGAFTCYAAMRGANVHAYEPVEDNYRLLLENVNANGFSGNVKTNMLAVTKSGGEVKLYLCKSQRNKYRHSIIRHSGWNFVTINSLPFDFILSSGVNCIKLDCEGAELDIFDSHPDYSKIKKMVFEYHFDLDRSIDNFLARMSCLSRFYNLVHYSKLPPGKTYDYFPASKIVYCQNV